ncbi:hypothetical protein ILYODFUR_033348 [Ilyodon furcidens]|uniref:Uncharacterized protein n=1 Tax=Ilyodon furcidens TaxID=33524 RepID=A0ABV0UYA2_9TELE
MEVSLLMIFRLEYLQGCLGSDSFRSWQADRDVSDSDPEKGYIFSAFCTTSDEDSRPRPNFQRFSEDYYHQRFCNILKTFSQNKIFSGLKVHFSCRFCERLSVLEQGFICSLSNDCVTLCGNAITEVI